MITMIPRSKLEPHPDNPRKDLGDLSELAASIRKQGLLQNLTVVPSPDHPDKYCIVIGHRRFAASGIAELEELPCVVDDKMTYPEQIAVMMSENIQRNDLTITERVGGVQMMMDLGMGIGEISGSTGISDTTIRRYAKIGKLNRGGMAQAEQRGATLMQFAEISEIEDKNLRREALEKAGTSDYSSVMYKVRTARDRNARMPLMVEKLNRFATEIEKEDYSRYTWIGNYYYRETDCVDKIDQFKRKKGAKYAYVIAQHNISVYEERPACNNAKEQAKREERERMRERADHERNIAAAFREMRDVYMAAITLKGREEAAKRFVLWVLTRSEYISQAMIGGLFDRMFLANRTIEDSKPANYTSGIKVSADEVMDIPEKKLLLGLVLVTYDRISGGDMTMLDRYSGKPKDAITLHDLYRHMEALGYPISTEERAWLDGTHECFTYPHDAKEGE